MNSLVGNLYIGSLKEVGDWHNHQTVLDPEKFAKSIIQEWHYSNLMRRFIKPCRSTRYRQSNQRYLSALKNNNATKNKCLLFVAVQV